MISFVSLKSWTNDIKISKNLLNSMNTQFKFLYDFGTRLNNLEINRSTLDMLFHNFLRFNNYPKTVFEKWEKNKIQLTNKEFISEKQFMINVSLEIFKPIFREFCTLYKPKNIENLVNAAVYLLNIRLQHEL